MTTKATRFVHDGDEYEIRVVSEEQTTHVRAFINGAPANGYIYSVDLLTQIDARMSGSEIDPVRALVETCEADVRSGVWNQYVATVNVIKGTRE